MKILLDTHILLWLLVGDPMLSRSARKILEDARNEIFFSTISIAEIAIKHVKNPELMPVTPEEVRDAALEDNLHELNFESVHAVALAGLPLLHKDPFKPWGQTPPLGTDPAPSKSGLDHLTAGLDPVL